MTWSPSFAYREASAQNASPVRLVILLYEQLIKDLQRAASTFEANQVEERTKAIDHALVVVGHLQASLDMEHGGEVARNLERFYGLLRDSLIDAQTRRAPEILGKQLGYLLELRSAWLEVERATAPPASEPAPGVSAQSTAPSDVPPHANWTA